MISVSRRFFPTKLKGSRIDDRRVLNGIFCVLRSDAPGRDLPERYGPRTTCYNCLVRWRKAGIRGGMMDAMTVADDGAIQMIDSTSIRAHQLAATEKGELCFVTDDQMQNAKYVRSRRLHRINFTVHTAVFALPPPLR